MPNHIHGIIVIQGRGEPRVRPTLGGHQDRPYQTRGDHEDRPYRKGHDAGLPRGTLPGTVGRIVQGFKSETTDAYIRGVKEQGWPRFPGKLWHRNYYEHIIRNEDEPNRIREYICNNPLRWPYDAENPDRRADAVDDIEDILSCGNDPLNEL
jgi:REP element-mobilizing transposase RayT